MLQNPSVSVASFKSATAAFEGAGARDVVLRRVSEREQGTQVNSLIDDKGVVSAHVTEGGF